MKVVRGLVASLVCAVLLLVGCGNGHKAPLGATSDLTSFSFAAATNASLASDITASVTGTSISATVPGGTDVTHLVATFATDGMQVEVAGVAQVSGMTANDFTSPVEYDVYAQDGSMTAYSVTVQRAPLSSEKAITSFSFLAADNPALTTDAIGTITGTSITMTVPYGTDVTALVATFVTTGASVDVGLVPQISGTTSNSFRIPRPYIVTAADGTTNRYLVTVLVDTGSVTCTELVGPSIWQPNSAFGNAAAISGDGSTLVVGAWLDASNATGVNGDETSQNMSRAGAAYVFVRSGASWVRQAYLKASNTNAGDEFGYAVAISDDGNTIAVGADDEASDGSSQANNSLPGAGAVYVFVRTGSTWTQQAYLKSFMPSQSFFGSAVALSRDGSTLAAGAPFTGPSNLSSTTVFARSGTTWSTQTWLAFGYGRGETLALSQTGDVLVVGGSATTDVYVRNGTWNHVADLPVGADSVAISSAGDEILCGSPYGGGPGAAYVFTGSGSTWTQQAMLVASNGDAGDYFGFSTALSADGTLAAVGAYVEASNATCTGGDPLDNSITKNGAVYRFALAGTWSQTAYVKAPTARASQQFGYAVSLPDDGSVLVVGAPGTAIVSIGQ